MLYSLSLSLSISHHLLQVYITKLRLHINMTERRCTDTSSRMCTEMKVNVGSMPFTLDKELLASKSAKVAALLKENPNEDLSSLLRDIPADAETFELVARFCRGYSVQMSTENIVPLICLSFYLGMDENHSNNNLLSKAVTFFEQRVLPSWNEIIKALRVSEKFIQQIMEIGLFDACLQSMVAKVSDNPRYLGEPMMTFTNYGDDEDGDDSYRPNARRRLFALDWQEDLTTLPLQLYEPIIYRMNQHEISPEYISASIYQYAKRWIFLCNVGGETMTIFKRKSLRNLIETLERLSPHGRLLPCKLLFEMLHCAIDLEASSVCREGFEIRIGKQLDLAKVEDLLLPFQGYAKKGECDVECIRRILKIFYGNYKSSDVSGLITVAELTEQFLAEIAGDIDLMIDTFISLAEISTAAAYGTHRNCDGIYQAIDIYLEKHPYLTEKEKEQVCRVLDFRKMSLEACEHAAKNERLPVRVVVQVLFMAQLQLRETMANDVRGYDDKSGKEEEEEDKVRMEMEKMSIKVKELENDCFHMKKEITGNCIRQKVKQGKVSMWTEMKRKFGCMSGNDFQCPVKKKKVHPKFGI